MAKPSPEPGLASSRRTPRNSASPSSPSGRPAPSSSTSMATRLVGRPDGPAAAMRTATRPRPYLHAFSIRLPSISVTSCGSARTRAPGAPETAMAMPRAACSRRSADARASAAAIGALSAPALPASAPARARRRWCCTSLSNVSAWPRAASRSPAASALRSTATGVLSAWARLPTWRRAFSTVLRFWSISASISATSGAISAGATTSMCSRRPWRTSTSSSCVRRSGRSPQTTSSATTRTRPVPKPAKASTIFCRRPAISASTSPRATATCSVRFTRPARLSICTSRSSSRSDSPRGPGTVRTRIAPPGVGSGGGSRASHREREVATRPIGPHAIQ